MVQLKQRVDESNPVYKHYSISIATVSVAGTRKREGGGGK